MKHLLKKPICFCISLILIINFNVTFAQQAKVVSSYGPANQDVGLDQIRADRMKVTVDIYERIMEIKLVYNKNEDNTQAPHFYTQKK